MARGVKYTTESFISKAIEIHGNKYDYSKVEYKNANAKVTIICPIHGEFQQEPKAHIHLRAGCPKCGAIKMGHSKLVEAMANFEIKANLVHHNRYDYSKVNYINNSTNISIICPIHGEFFQTPNNHLKGAGCPVCGVNAMADKIRISIEDFKKRASLIHNGKYDYHLSKFMTGEDKTIIVCPKHGEFKQRVSLHLQGSGCPHCNESQGEKRIRKWLLTNNINFIAQYRFNDCRNIRPLPFDFYLPNYNTCIEFDGIQHFEETYQFMGLKNAFHYTQNNDKIKNNYCKTHNIKLIRIKYTDIDKIPSILSLYISIDKEKI